MTPPLPDDGAQGSGFGSSVVGPRGSGRRLELAEIHVVADVAARGVIRRRVVPRVRARSPRAPATTARPLLARRTSSSIRARSQRARDVGPQLGQHSAYAGSSTRLTRSSGSAPRS